MRKKIFAISDIHGYYQEMKNALDKAGYDEKNPEHLLIVLGDIFDRGEMALTTYEYLKRLSDEGKAICLMGNHEPMLYNYLDGTCIDPFNYFNNGTDETLADFWHRTKPFQSWCTIDKNIDAPTYGDFAAWISEARKDINEEYPELIKWLKDRPYYYETKNYIFTHGAIDVKVTDWHKPHCERYHFIDWEALTWNDGSFFGEKINNTDKTVVIGHFGTAHLRRMYPENGTGHGILKRKDGKVIALDAATCLTKDVNVLIIEDEIEI